MGCWRRAASSSRPWRAETPRSRSGRSPMPETLPDKPSSFTRHVWIVVGIVVLVLAIWKLAPVLLLFFAGVTFAVAVRAGAVPIARRLHVKDVWGVAIVGLLALAVFAAGSYFFGQRVTAQAQDLVGALQ